jgi:hypothetical protein
MFPQVTDGDFIDPILKDALGFSDFGPTKNWVGFFEISDKLTRKNIDTTIYFLMNAIEKDLDSFTIAVSCFIDDNKEPDYKIYKDVIEAENKLTQAGIVKRIDQEKYFNYENNDEFDKQHFELCTSFRYYLPDNKLIKELSLIRLCESNVKFNDGYCFFVSIKNNVIIYPHGDNSGYGFYIINKNENSIAHKILESASMLFFLNCKINHNLRS